MSEPIPGLYKHYKGDYYIVIDVLQDSTNGCADVRKVLYFSEKLGKFNIRNVDEFLSSVVTQEGHYVPRFRLICANESIKERCKSVFSDDVYASIKERCKSVFSTTDDTYERVSEIRDLLYTTKENIDTSTTFVEDLLRRINAPR